MSRTLKLIYKFDSFVLDAEERVLLRDGRMIPLTPKVFETLLLLVKNQGSIVTKQTILETLWPDVFVEESNVTFNITMLRKAIGDTTERPVYIETLPRRGYRFKPEVRAILEDTPFKHRLEIGSLAVLPMANLSGDPVQDYFADGMTETLIAGLAKIGALRVISRTSVMQYKGARKPLREIARELNVGAIVEGSVQRFGERGEITVQLIYAPTERHLMSETYHRDLRDMLTLQNEIARAVTQEVQIRLTPHEQIRLARALPINGAAFDYFLRGRFHVNRRTKDDN